MSDPVTTVVRRRVRPGHHEEYEAWLRNLLSRADGVQGYQGTDVHPPAPGDHTYTSVFRFGSIDDLEAFQRGDLYREAMEEVVPLVEGDAVWDSHTGLEFWFSPPPGTMVAQPVRWRMALLIGVVVYLLVLAFGRIAATIIGGWPSPLRLALVIAVEITLMTYVLLPWLTRRLARWIFPTTRSA